MNEINQEIARLFDANPDLNEVKVELRPSWPKMISSKREELVFGRSVRWEKKPHCKTQITLSSDNQSANFVVDNDSHFLGMDFVLHDLFCHQFLGSFFEKVIVSFPEFLSKQEEGAIRAVEGKYKFFWPLGKLGKEYLIILDKLIDVGFVDLQVRKTLMQFLNQNIELSKENVLFNPAQKLNEITRYLGLPEVVLPKNLRTNGLKYQEDITFEFWFTKDFLCEVKNFLELKTNQI